MRANCLLCELPIPPERQRLGNVRFCTPDCSSAYHKDRENQRQIRKHESERVIAVRPLWGNPQEEPQHWNDADTAAAARQLDCAKYNRCLDHAVQHDWTGFNCRACVQYEVRRPKTKSEARESQRRTTHVSHASCEIPTSRKRPT